MDFTQSRILYAQSQKKGEVKKIMANTERNKGFGIIEIVIALLIILVLGLIGWWVIESKKTTPAPAAIKPNDGYVVIEEWGVRFKLVEGLEGVEYFQPKDIDGFTFTTNKLTELPNCAEQSGRVVLGLLSRNQTILPAYGGVLKQINGYYYQYQGPQSTCSETGKEEGSALLKLSESLKSIEAVERN